MAQRILIAMDASENVFRSVESVAKSLSAGDTAVLSNVPPETVALGNMESKAFFPGGISQNVFTGAGDISVLIAD